jgi:formylglycine-generating enzyme required for sulfatase activity
MVLIKASTSYCIDATEVTQLAYAVFWLSGSKPALSAACSWKVGHLPSCSFSSSSNLPVGCVDWCDAQRYCAWAGKRLCGAIGGGPAVFASGADPASEWYRACAGANGDAYPYGDVYEGQTCVTSDYDGVSGYQAQTDELQPAGSAAGCVGSVEGLHDMSGNVSEWVDACDDEAVAPQDQHCLDRSATYYWSANENACDFAWTVDKRSDRYVDVGFRCCADPI